MSKLQQHPSVVAFRQREQAGVHPPRRRFRASELRERCLELGADDVGIVEVERPAIADQRDEIEQALPGTRLLISFLVRMNRDSIRSPARSIANLEFHHTGDETNAVAREIVTLLADAGWRALNPSMGFPMEMDQFPGRTWVVSHKPVAVAAGLGQIGIHRNLIHRRFGNFVLLGTVLTDAELEPDPEPKLGQPIDFNPCLECKLCVAACPVGAIKPDGAFDFSACYTHNYREFMGGFTDFMQTVADSADGKDFRRRVSDAESTSMWQSLSFGANYKAAYCLAVCPAGEDVIAPFLADRREFTDRVVRPLQAKVEPLYVVPGSDAEAHAARRFPHKPIRRVGNGIRPNSIAGFLRGMPLSFQRDKSKDVRLRVQFRFVGDEPREATVVIADGGIDVLDGWVDTADLRVTVDSQTWLDILAGERKPLAALLTRKLRIEGPPKLMAVFRSCFA